ncbi:MAG TPA: cytochrome c family protein [Stellaceae bacterium]|nr:cytochrome c family protein [Stellaceae bacterium]
MAGRRRYAMATKAMRRDRRANILREGAQMSKRVFVTVMLGTLVAAGSAYAAGDAAAGKEVFKKCALCHTTEAGKNKIGPSLAGVMDRDAGTAPNFSYSEAMKNFKHKWTPEELDTYLTDPRKVVPGTKMIFPGLKEEKDRQNVIAYLATLK